MNTGTAAGRQLEAALRKQSKEALVIDVVPAPRDSMIRISVTAAGRTAYVESQAPSGPVLVTVDGSTSPVVVGAQSGPRLIHLTPCEIAVGILELLLEPAANPGASGLLLMARGTMRRQLR